MKSLRITIVTIILLALNADVKSQSTFMLDSIEFRMNNHLSMKIISENYHEVNEWQSIDSLFALFLQDLDRMEDIMLTDGKSNNMNYFFKGQYRSIQVNKESSVENEVSIDEKGNVIYFQTVQFNINEREKIIFKSPSLDGFREIGRISMDELIEVSDTVVFANGRGYRNHKSTILFVENDQIQSNKTIKRDVAFDTIELGGVIGLGTVRSTLTPDIEAVLMVRLSNKGIKRNQFGISYQAQFFFPQDNEGKLDVKIDGFLNLIYASSQAFGSSRTHQIGVKVGALINQSSSTFENETYKFGMFKGFAGGIVLESGIYAVDNFSQWFPYMRLEWSW